MPATSSVHVDAALSNLLVQEGVGSGFAYEKAFPTFGVQKKSDKFFKLYREEIRQDVPTKRSARDAALEWTWETQQDSYSCHMHKLKSPIYQDELDNADPALNMREITALKNRYKIQLDLEKEARSILTDTSTYSYATPSVKWDASTGTIDIFGDIKSAKEAFRKAFGRNPNLMIIEPDVAAVIQNNSDFLDRLKYTNPNLVRDDGLPSPFMGMQIFVPGALEDSANPSAAESIDDIWNTDKVMLLFVNPSQTPVMGEPSFGYNIVWKKFGANGWKVKTWMEEDPEREYIWAAHYHEFKVVASHGLYIINDTLT